MFSSRLKSCISWPLARAHLCSVAIALSFHSTWRVPRDGVRYGAVPYGLVLTAMLAVAAPAMLLQLAAGQLSQQDAVGMWRAVPFFKGVGYLRLLVSCVGAVYTAVYVSLLVTFFLYTASHDIPFAECSAYEVVEEEYQNLYNGTTCLQSTFLGSASENPEYFTAVSLVIIVLWTVFPFLLFNPVKIMKHALYPLGLITGVLFIVVLATTTGQGLSGLPETWSELAKPGLWFAAVTQAMWSSQVAGGYMVVAGDTVYATTSVQWSALFFTASNIIASWSSLLFWGAVGGGDVTGVAVLVSAYDVADKSQLGLYWPLLVFAALFFSGIITMFTLLFPLYDHFRRIGGYKWRYLSIGFSAIGAGSAIATLAGSLPALALLEDTVAPLLISVATVVEVLSFVLIYGKQNLVEDIEFLLGRDLPKAWTWGWYGTPVVVVISTTWWLVSSLLAQQWTEPPWTASAICATLALATLVLTVFATTAILRQVQYDFCEKLQASFRPSRHWGPRDPITHYYWLARRDEGLRGAGDRYLPPPRHSTRASLASVSKHVEVLEAKGRSNSDDWVYTGHRQSQVKQAIRDLLPKTRSKSLDRGPDKHTLSSAYFTPLDSLASLGELNNNVMDVKNLFDSVK